MSIFVYKYIIMQIKSSMIPVGFLVASLFFGSCRARFYTPNRNPVPLFKNAGDLYIDASSNLLNKVDITAGIAPIKGVGTYIGYGSAFQSVDSDSGTNASTRKYNGSMLNLGLGYFLTEDISQQFRFEIYADLGLGNFNNKISGADNQFFNGKYTRIGIMPNIGYTSSDNHFAWAYSVRMSNIRFHSENISDNNFWQNDIERYNSRSSYGLLEQAMIFRVGSEAVKFQMQIASYHGLNSDEVYNAIPTWNASIMIGVVFTPNLFK